MMMLPLRIRKAEVALKDGRLEEAWQQAVRDDVRDHRKGQRLIGRLTKAYQQRAQVHKKAGNTAAAMTDAERAVRLGGNQPELVRLRDEIRTELDARYNERNAKQQKIAAAKRCIASGNYTMGAKLCSDFKDGKTAVGLMQDADLNRQQVESTVERGRKALKSSQWEQALDALDEASRLQGSHSAVVALQADTVTAIAKQVRESISKGRLDQADLFLNRVRRHSSSSIEVQELSRVVEQCRAISLATRTVNVSNTVADLKALKLLIPQARWLDEAIKDAEAIARSAENLRTGPLSSLVPAGVTESTLIRKVPSQSKGRGPAMKIYEATAVVPDNFLIHLDGTGSVLVARGDFVSIGSPGRSKRVDVPIQSQTGQTSLSIERMDEDYFMSSDVAMLVNGKLTTSTLLGNQDQIRVGRRGSMQFSLPNSASTSAAIDFAGIRLAAGNARRVILMDDSIVIGPQPSAHIQSLALERAMVIHWRNGELRIRPMSRSLETEGQALAMNQPHDIDGLSLVVTAVKETGVG